ncbi:cytochrome c [Paenibacillus sp. cl123]|nr:cytochrome c [Paenibacillus sp. cl123]
MYRWTMVMLGAIACFLGVTVLFMKAEQRQNEIKHEAAAPALPDTPLNAQAAEAIYKQSCLACHGAELEGKLGPNLQKVGGKLSDQQIYKVLLNGKGGMPAFKSTLKDEELVNLAKWLAEKK